MPITRPTTKTLISTTQWGIPITDAVNANTTDVAALKTTTNVTAWALATYQNGFVTGVGRPVQYCKLGTLVVVRGVAVGGTANTTIFNLPAGFRPGMAMDFATIVGSGFGAIAVSTAGDVSSYVGAAGQGIFLNFSFVI